MEPVPKKRVTRKSVLVKTPVPATKRTPVAVPKAAKKAVVPTKKVEAKKRVTVKKVASKSTEASVKVKVTAAKSTRSSKGIFSAPVVPSRRFIPKTALPDTEKVSFIPGTVSLRLKERAALYEAWFKNDSSRYAQKAASVFGYAFITFGFIFAFAFSAHTTLSQSALFANITCSLGTECTTLMETTNGGSTTPTVVLMPIIQFVTSPVVVPGQNTDVVVSIQNAFEHRFFVYSHQTGDKKELNPIGTDGQTMYTYRIPTKDMLPGEYKIYIRAIALDRNTISEFSGPTFLVPVPPTTNTTSNTTTTSTNSTETASPSTLTTSGTSGSGSSSDSETTNISTTTSLVESTTSSGSDTTSDTGTSDPAVDENIPEEDVVDVVSEEEDVEEAIEAPVAAIAPTEEIKTEAMSVSLMPGVFPRQYKIAIVPTYKYTSIELYLRPENAIQMQFLGVASKTSTGWLYWLDASSLPSGKYKVIVRGMDYRTIKETAEIRFENEAPKPTYQQEPEYTTTKEEVELQTTKMVTATTSPLAPLSAPTTEMIPTLLTSPYQTATSVPLREEEREKAQEILTTYSDEFNDILRSYASAIQSGDENLLRLSESALSEKIYESLTEKVLDTEFENSIYTLESDIRIELEGVIEQIKRVEEFKKERTALASTEDTDGDGITDYDEYLLYGTDPKNPDTDNDGVTDGVEISQGYDPMDEKPEAVIRFNSPKEVSYEDASLLGVDAVAPLLVYEDETEPVSVQSEIKGYGLPNSFVTLYIFSDPIVVTVKTKDDGSFSYTFTKELEDGEHEVYAALTDNKGEIVARSTAFKFVKTAEAYTYVSAENETAAVLTEGGLTSHERTYNLVAAMGVVSFGLILLLLGFTLRQESKVEVVTAV